MMQISRISREYANWGFVNLPTAPPTPEVRFGLAWYTLEWYSSTGSDFEQLVEDLGLDLADVTAQTSRIARVLVAGPGAIDNPAGTVVLAMGNNVASVKFTDASELLVRPAGEVFVTL